MAKMRQKMKRMSMYKMKARGKTVIQRGVDHKKKTRREIYKGKGKKKQTRWGLKKADLKKSVGKPGKIVSKKVSEQAKQRYDKPDSPVRLWNEATYVVRINMFSVGTELTRRERNSWTPGCLSCLGRGGWDLCWHIPPYAFHSEYD